VLLRRLGLSSRLTEEPSFEARAVSHEWIAQVFDQAQRMGLGASDFYQMGLDTVLRFQKGGAESSESPLAPVIQESFEKQKVGSELGCIQRTGAAAAFPAHGGRGLTRTRHTRCVFRGDPYCEFEVDLQTGRSHDSISLLRSVS